MSTAIAKPQELSPERKRLLTVKDLLAKSQEQIAIALPKHMTAERMIRVATTTISRTPKLLECTPISLVGCVVQASELGLELNGFLGEAYLVPFWNSRARCLEAQFQAGYRGLISLARRSGQVALVYSELVYHCDKFKVAYGLHKNLEHEPDLDNLDRGRRDETGNLIGLRGAYAVVKYKDGEFDFEYLPLAKLNELRARSKSKNKDGEENGPWVTDPDQMYRKVPIRQLAKRLPLSPEFQKAAILDEYGDVGVRQNLGAEIASNTAFSGVMGDLAANTTQTLADKYLAQQPAQDEHSQDGPPLEAYAEGESAPDPTQGFRHQGDQPMLDSLEAIDPFKNDPSTHGFDAPGKSGRRGH
jgi:recombination protein RecT